MKALALAAALVAGCQARTEIVLGFATDFKAPVPLDEVKLDVIRQDGFPEGGDGLTWSISGAPGAPYNLPASYGIYSDDSDVQLDVTLSGLSGGSAIVSQTVTLSLVSSQTLFYRMGLTGECSNVDCGAMTCIEGNCVDPAVLVHQLPLYTPELVDELTCIPPHVTYVQTQDGSPMPFSANAASCPPDLCVQGLCLNPPGKSGGGGGSNADTYLKPGYVSAGAYYGELDELAMSADGNTLVIGGADDGLGGVGVDPDETGSPQAMYSGGAYVFERSGTTWTQSAYLKSSNDEANDFFGQSVAISADGTTIAIGAIGEASDATGIAGDQTDNSVPGAGAVYVFTRDGSSWTQSAYLKPAVDVANGLFGIAVALSSDGTTLAVGEKSDNSEGTGIDSGPNSAGAGNGSVYVFESTTGMWSQQAYIKPTVTHDDDDFGASVALSSDGNTLAIGAIYESSTATGVNGDPSATGAQNSGAAYIFTRSGTTWMQNTYIKASNTEAQALFGGAVALSAAGDELAVGAPRETSSATGIDGNQNDMSETRAGAAYIFKLSGTWSQQAYVKASNTAAMAGFGIALAFSGDGNTLIVGAYSEDSDATGLDGDQTDTSATASGAAYMFTQSAGTWSQSHYIKSSNTSTEAYFGYSIAIGSDGSTYAIGAPGDSSDATGVDGNGSDTSAADDGAAYVFPP
ncbi:MAG TPA: hypothetical protein VGG74_03740 [Kofleriaceae bacterium]|jgi:hypothetical protein